MIRKTYVSIGLFPLLALACEGGWGGIPDNGLKKCVAINTDEFDEYVNYTVTLPPCPHELTEHGESESYSVEMMGAEANYIPSSGPTKMVRHVVKAANGDTVVVVQETSWNLFTFSSPDSARAVVAGNYPAGTATGLTGNDSLLVESETISVSGGRVKGIVLFEYEHKPDVSMSGPVTSDTYTNVTISASVTQADAPVTYSWKRNGSSISGSGSSITNQVGGEGIYNYEVTVTDSEGDVKVQSHAVNVQPECEFCVDPPPPDTIPSLKKLSQN